jgi:hypothetical protein
MKCGRFVFSIYSTRWDRLFSLSRLHFYYLTCLRLSAESFSLWFFSYVLFRPRSAVFHSSTVAPIIAKSLPHITSFQYDAKLQERSVERRFLARDIFYSDSRSKIFAIRDVFESKFSRNFLDVSRRWLKRFFFFKVLFTIATIFFLFKKFCAFLTIEIFTLFSRLLFAKQLLFDFSSIVFKIFDELLFTFDKTNYRWLINWKKYFFFFHFCSWKCSYSRSKLIFWNLNSRYFCFRSQFRFRNFVYETSCSQNLFLSNRYFIFKSSFVNFFHHRVFLRLKILLMKKFLKLT